MLKHFVLAGDSKTSNISFHVFYTTISNPTYPFIETNKYVGWCDIIMADSYFMKVFNSFDNIQYYAQESRDASRTCINTFLKKIIQCSARNKGEANQSRNKYILVFTVSRKIYSSNINIGYFQQHFDQKIRKKNIKSTKTAVIKLRRKKHFIEYEQNSFVQILTVQVDWRYSKTIEDPTKFKV